MNVRWHLIGNILFAILSVIYCLIAPGEMNVSFCAVVTATFLAHNIWHFATLDRNNRIGFELFFAIAFFFINFLFPTVIYSLDPNYSFFARSFNVMVISRATAIAYLGYAWFLLGATSILHGKRQEPTPTSLSMPHGKMNLIFGLAMLSFVLFMVSGGWKALQAVYADGEDLAEVGIYSYFRTLFIIFSYLLAAFVFTVKGWKRWLYITFLMVCVVLLLTTGSRSFALGTMLILLVGFNNNVRSFRFWEIAAVVLLGVAALYLVVVLRSGEEFTDEDGIGSSIGFLGIFMDLIINNRNLYVLVDYADAHGLTFLHGMLVDIFAPIPGMTNVLLTLTGDRIEMINGGSLPTLIDLGADASWGLGTNMIGEIYRSFGYAGTVVYMFLVGHLVKTCYYRSTDNIYAYVVYYILCSHAVMWGRAPMLPDMRLLTWTLLIVFLLTRPVQLTWRKEE